MKVTKKDQIRKYAAWLWQGVNAQICNVIAGGAYHIGIVDTTGSVEKQLTPCYKTIPELLAYLQGLHAAKNNPAIFDKMPFDASVYAKQV